jgi:tetratricopeptide (TPR) repeat protein
MTARKPEDGPSDLSSDDDAKEPRDAEPAAAPEPSTRCRLGAGSGVSGALVECLMLFPCIRVIVLRLLLVTLLALIILAVILVKKPIPMSEKPASKQTLAAEKINEGIAHESRNEYDKALQCFNESIHIDPNGASSFIAYTYRGVIHTIKGEYSEAIDDYGHCLAFSHISNKYRAYVLTSRSYAYFQIKDYAKTIDDCTQALRFNHEDSEAADTYCSRGRAYQKMNQYDNAIDDYSAALRLDPVKYHASFNFFYNRGHAYLVLKNYAKAIDDFTQSLRLTNTGSDRARVCSYRGQAYYNLKQYSNALDDYSEALRIDSLRYANLTNAIESLKRKLK